LIRRKLLLGSGFALVTPVGMAVGIAVLERFNGNGPATIIAIGALDALSAGIFVWLGVVEMWASGWMPGGGMADTGVKRTRGGKGGGKRIASLFSGMILMSALGMWA